MKLQFNDNHMSTKVVITYVFVLCKSRKHEANFSTFILINEYIDRMELLEYSNILCSHRCTTKRNDIPEFISISAGKLNEFNHQKSKE